MTTEPRLRMTTTGVEAVSAYLRAEGVPHEVIEHDRTLTAAAEAEVTSQRPDEVAKTIVLHDGAVYLLAVIPGSERLDVRKLRDVLGAGRSVEFATEAQMAADFPMIEVGAMPPLGPVLPAAEVIDRRLLDEEHVVFAAGDHTHSVVVDPRNILAATEAQVADICQD